MKLERIKNRTIILALFGVSASLIALIPAFLFNSETGILIISIHAMSWGLTALLVTAPEVFRDAIKDWNS